jgi:hypothetical protein
MEREIKRAMLIGMSLGFAFGVMAGMWWAVGTVC